jgi:hypothetical protein
MKIQYFCSDLSHILKIGEIKEMHVDTVNGRMVLRIDYDELVEDEYVTVKATTSKKPAVKKPVKKSVSKPEPNILEKVATGAHGWLKGKQNDDWVKKFSDGPKW